MTTFNDFMNAPLDDSQKISDFYLNFLGEFSNKNFPFDEQLKLKGAGSKFIDSIEKAMIYIGHEKKQKYIDLIDDFQKEFRIYRRIKNTPIILRFVYPTVRKSMVALQEVFQILYTATLVLINEAMGQTYYFDDIDVNSFFKPENSNKQKIKDLIREAIGLIREDSTLTEITKKNIIEYLEKSLEELERKRVDWARFIGRIKEVVIVLGALGSFAGGANSLFQAKDKLEQSTDVIQKTSVNINFNIISKTFNIQNIKQLNTITNIIELPENCTEEIYSATEN